ncbi:vomeronasal type-2 receptor 26-like [Protopterus annectens]|uniref:vomeronasal type-2 receptor 26-like n=1 Tax=Protopterus annectens TaxID=7888 RepID=UPI001CFBE995|nr:vomeronasal type-2 receptor 26-like [Protopterus annectens]
MNKEKEFFFDANGNPPAVYDILNWQATDESYFQQVKVGQYDFAALPGQEFVINKTNIIWKTHDGQIPVSICSKSCQPGYKQIMQKGKPSCCFDCVPCADGWFTNKSDSASCLTCADDEWTDEKHDRCIKKHIEFLSYEEPLGAALSAATIISALLPTGILVTFIRYRDTTIVKVNNREISYILLLALIMCALCSFIFIGRPTQMTCMLGQQTFAIVFALCISCVLAKTTVVVIAFKAIKPNSRLKKFVGVGSVLPSTIVLICTFIQVIISVTWLGIAPPFVESNMKLQKEKIILQCTDGSGVVFWCILGYMGILASISFVLAFLSRNLPDSFSETKYITFSMIAFGSVWLSFIPAYLSTQGKYMATVEIFAILSSSNGLLVCIFIPKCYIILLRPEMNVKEYLMGKRHAKTIKVI